MMRSAGKLLGYNLNATDGNFGKCKDLLFDDQMWTIRHLMATPGLFKMGHLVLISPVMIDKPDWETENIYLNVSQKALEDCPSPSEDEPVSREHEKRVYDHFRYPYYWAGVSLWGVSDQPVVQDITGEKMKEPAFESSEKIEETNHLRSFKEVKGYDIKARDGFVGHVQDFIMDDVTWAFRYVIVDTRNWLPGGKKVILSLDWARSVNWMEKNLKWISHGTRSKTDLSLIHSGL